MEPFGQHLFRAEALRHHLDAEEGKGLVRISPPWTWALLWIVLTGIGVALMASFLGSVEVNGRGRGIVHPSAGVHTLLSQSGGTVGTIEVCSGQLVRAGSILLRINAPTVQGQVLEADRQVEAVRTQYRTITSKQDIAYQEQSKRLASRIAQLEEQLASQKKSIQIFERRLKANLLLEKEGLVSTISVDEAREALAQAERQALGLQQSLDQAHQEMASLENRRLDELWQQRQVVTNAGNKRDALSFLQGQTVVQAPEDGVVEALLVKPGEVIQPGQVVGKLIPLGSPLQVVSFLAEKDRAFVKVGDMTRLELDQLPYAEYGTLGARVLRISDDLASPFEIKEALGEEHKLEVPAFRVELELTDMAALDAARVKLRTGMLLNVRYTLRRQRLITLLLDPLRRWFR